MSSLKHRIKQVFLVGFTRARKLKNGSEEGYAVLQQKELIIEEHNHWWWKEKDVF